MKLRRWVAAEWVLLILALLCQPSVLWADGGFFAKQRVDMGEPNQRAAIFFDQGVEDLIIQVQFSGAASDFGWIVPLPSKPEVSVVDADVFPELRAYTFARSKWGVYAEDFAGGYAGRGSGAPGLAGGPSGDVEVYETKKVGVYEISTLRAGEADALVEWCQSNGYHVPESAMGILDEYVSKRWVFAAMRIASAEQSVGQELQSGTIQPVRFSFATDEAIYPLRISAINGSASDVLVYVLANDTLIHPAFETRHGPNPAEFWGYRLEKASNGNSKQAAQFASFFDDAHASFRAIGKEELPLCRQALTRLGKGQYFLSAQQQNFKSTEMTFDAVFQPIERLSPDALDALIRKNLNRAYRIDPLLLRVNGHAAQLGDADLRGAGASGSRLAKNWETRPAALLMLAQPGRMPLLEKVAGDASDEVRDVLEKTIWPLLFERDYHFFPHDIASEGKRGNSQYQARLASAGFTGDRFQRYCRYRLRAREVPGRESFFPLLMQLYTHCAPDSESPMMLAALGTKEAVALLVEGASGKFDDPRLSTMFRREMALSALRSVKAPELAKAYGRIFLEQRESLTERELAFCLCGLWVNGTADSETLVREMETYCQVRGFALAVGIANDILVNKLKVRRPALAEGMTLDYLEQTMGGPGKLNGKMTVGGKDLIRYTWETATVTVRDGSVLDWEWLSLEKSKGRNEAIKQ